MKRAKQLHYNTSDDEQLTEEQLQNEVDDNEEDEVNESDEGDEVDDNEDFLAEEEYVPNNSVKKEVIVHPRLLDGANKKIVLKKTASKKPSTQKLVDDAIKQLNERGGSSSEAIRKFIMNKNPDMIEDRLKIYIKRYIKNSITNGTMVQIKRSFKFTDKHEMRKKKQKKQKRISQKKKSKENENLEKEKRKRQEPENRTEKKAPKEVKSSKKTEDKTKPVKRTKEEKTETGSKPVKVAKSAKGTTASENRNMEKRKSKHKKSRKSINLVVKPTARPKTMKSTKTAASASKKKTEFPKGENVPVATTSGAVKTTGRGKKK